MSESWTKGTEMMERTEVVMRLFGRGCSAIEAEYRIILEGSFDPEVAAARASQSMQAQGVWPVHMTLRSVTSRKYSAQLWSYNLAIPKAEEAKEGA